MTRKQIFEHLGAPLHNYRWSWGSQSETGTVILFVWKDQIEGDRVLVADPEWTHSSGYKERLKHLKLIEAGAPVLCIIGVPTDTTTLVPRKYRSFDTDQLIEGGGKPYEDSRGAVWLSTKGWIAVDEAIRTRLSSLWQKSGLDSTDRTARSTLHGMAMGKRPGARQASPMWVNTEDLPTSDGHPFFERLNRVLEESGFDAFVEGLCEAFYACRLGRPSLRPGRYFRLLFIGYFEGVSSERGIAWRVADSLSLRSFLDLDVTEAAPDHSTLSRTRRLIDVETHVSVFTWVLERLADAGLVRGKTVGIDATTLEANAAMRSIERRDTGESYEAFVRSLAEASGVETPTRADLARFDRSRKNKKTSNKEWKSPQDPDAKIAKMKDGRTHMAHKAEHGVDMDTGAIVSVTVQDASDGDTATLPETLIDGGRAGGVGAAGRSGG